MTFARRVVGHAAIIADDGVATDRRHRAGFVIPLPPSAARLAIIVAGEWRAFLPLNRPAGLPPGASAGFFMRTAGCECGGCLGYASVTRCAPRGS
jgi:hypothetical protein